MLSLLCQWRKDPENANQLHSAIMVIHLGSRDSMVPTVKQLLTAWHLQMMKDFRDALFTLFNWNLYTLVFGDTSKSIDFEKDMKNIQKVAT